MNDQWPTLVQRYAEGRPICNCGNAYYTPCGTGWIDGQERNDLLACQHGCQANQLIARREISGKVLAELRDHEA